MRAKKKTRRSSAILHMFKDADHGSKRVCGRTDGWRGGYTEKRDKYIRTIYNKANEMDTF